MGPELVTMGMGMRVVSFGEALFLLGMVRGVRGEVIGRMVVPVSFIPLPVLAIGFPGMVGSVGGLGIPLLSFGHMRYSAFSFI
jgi:hypothetical protein